MKKLTAVFATTKMDRQGEQITKEALEDMASTLDARTSRCICITTHAGRLSAVSSPPVLYRRTVAFSWSVKLRSGGR